jgi:hypothetical protein
MLAAQMAVVHEAMMTFAVKLAHVEIIPQQDSAERAFNKLARTFVTQMEALKRYRTGGEQKVTAQHVCVSEGGQAIVGHATQAAAREIASGKSVDPPPLSPMRSNGECQLSARRSVRRLRRGAIAKSHQCAGELMGDRLLDTAPLPSRPRCGAKTRSGKPCVAAPVRGKKRCWMHGGAPPSGAPRGNQNARKYGLYTREALEERRQLQDLMRHVRRLLQAIE